MPARTRKLVGGLFIVGYMIAWIVLAVMLGERLPDNRWIQTLYFLIAGAGWGIPLYPLFVWMNRGG